MRLSDIFAKGDFSLSIEIFPPKTPAGDEALKKHLDHFTKYNPSFVSCTYGAGGTTQDRTLDWCKAIQNDFKQVATAHFTCVNSTKEQLLDWLERASAAGVKNIMALRGDAPEGQESFTAVDGGLAYANELVKLIREHHPDFGIGVAGYPEKHPEAADLPTDLANLKRKVDAGADAVFTQLFFVNENFLRFRDNCVKAGINIPIVPGLMPITDFARINRITAMCGAVFPEDLSSRLEAVKDDKAAQFEIGVEYAIKQYQELKAAGVAGTHFYVLNKSKAVDQILNAV